MACSSNHAHYQDSLPSYHTRLYTLSHSSLGGNYHHKQISPTTSDQPSYHLKLEIENTQACPPGPKLIFPSYLSILQCRTEIQSYVHGPSHLIQNTK